jgi:uncharacterized membrane protein
MDKRLVGLLGLGLTLILVGCSDAGPTLPEVTPTLPDLKVATVFGEPVDLGTLSGGGPFGPFGMNNNAQIVGTARNAAGDLCCAVHWQNGQLTELATLPGYGFGDQAQEINDNGQAVGLLVTASGRGGEFLPVIWESPQSPPQALQLLPGTTGGVARGINEDGEIVGENRNGTRRAVLWQDATSAPIALPLLPGCSRGSAWDNNNKGMIVGFAFGCETVPGLRAVLWEGDQVTELATLPGSTGSWAIYLNDVGQIVGSVSTATGEHLVLWETPTQIVDLGTLTVPGTGGGFGINKHGQIALEFDRRAVVWEDGQMTDLGEGRATAINNKGQVAGSLGVPGDNIGVLWPGSKKVKKEK